MMSVFKCKMCGGDLEITEGMSVCECQYCGSRQTLPKLSDDKKKNLYDRANHFRRNNEYDKAMAMYEQILNEDAQDAESYWSIVLCKYGIEYVEDPATHRRVPTVNRAQMTSVFSDENYKSALKYADSEQRAIYEAEAKEIEQIQKGILAISSKEEPFDVFICYKESDASGRRTPDSVLANDLYHQLTQEGFKVFFARITLEDKLGSAYEPYIFAALNSAKVMVVLGTKPEYFTAIWVKNEWSRFLAQIKGGANKVLIPAYKDMDPYDLPEEFSHLQAQDMSKLGFMQDLIRGIKKLTGQNEKQEVKQAAAYAEYAAAGNGAQALVERAFLFLEDGDFSKADELCEQALNQDPKNAKAYVGKLMVSRQVKKQEDLSKETEILTEDNYFQKAIRFAEDGLKKELERCNGMIMDSNYEETLRLVKEEGVQGGIQAAINMLTTAIGYYESYLGWENKDAKLAALGEQKNNLLQKLYQDTQETVEKYCGKKVDAKTAVKALEEASESYKLLGDYENSKELLVKCETLLSGFQNKLRKARLKKMRRCVFAVSMLVIIVLAIVFTPRILQEIKYNKAIAYMDAEEYETARELFEELDYYKLSETYAEKCIYNQALEYMENCRYEKALSLFKKLDEDAYEDEIEFCEEQMEYEAWCEETYASAMQLKAKGKYDDAIAVLNEILDYSDSENQILECENLRNEEEYQKGMDYKQKGDYETAIKSFTKISDYKDSQEQILECENLRKEEEYQKGMDCKRKGDYETAIKSFTKISDYKDSQEQILECENLRNEEVYQKAMAYKNKKEYLDAIESFEEINEYKDSAEQLKECQKIIDESHLIIENKVVVGVVDSWKSTISKIIIPNGVTSIGGYAFSGCSSLTNIEIPDSVTSISNSAFSGCSSLNNVEIPNSVTSIEGSAFYRCSSLTNIEIPDSVTSIGAFAFRECSSLNNIKLPANIASIEKYAFGFNTVVTVSEGSITQQSLEKIGFEFD